HRWVATAAEKPMMGLIKRQRYNTRNPRQGPSCGFMVFLPVNDTHLRYAGERHENSRPRCLDFDPTRVSIRLDDSNVFIGSRVDNSQSSCPGIANANSNIKIFGCLVVANVIWICTD